MVLLGLIVWIAGAIVGGLIGDRKGHPHWGLWLSIAFAWLGVLIIACVPATPAALERQRLAGKRPCPWCQEAVRPGATVCPHCQRDVPTIS